ncbi:50S ribosomal protein L4 [Nakamurella antarctica]|uniref:Large ribosomal subunit protein uL4 n=1 Tax=Nakamurella antarctica TaxID=1902245 RepID=A0A3G8ZPI3_9ACTN|nr:50S ribosomal protein L4 [Nakamurella antarctica]AZI58697.1 50S ribosomal protein L4 [Nakamurella antarctica]
MTTVQITSPAGKAEGSVELPDSIFDAQASIPLMHQVVVAQLAAARQGTHSTKTRGEVSGGGKKPYRQKGTGRARQGSTRSPQFVGGGISHGPVPRKYDQRTPKKMKAAALRGALSDRARGGNIHILSSLVAGAAPSTKGARSALGYVSTAKNILVVISREDEVGVKSLNNLEQVHLLWADQLNTYDVLRSDDVVFTKSSFDEFLTFHGEEAAVVSGASVSTEKAPKADAAVKAPKAEKADVAEKAPKAEKAEKAPKAEKPAKADKPAKAAKEESEDDK